MKTSKHLWSKLKLFQQNILSISVQIGWHRSSGSLLCSPHTLVLSSQNSFLQHVVQTHSSANNQPRICKITTHQKTHVCPRNAVSQADLESGIPSQPHYHRGITGILFTIQELSIVVASSKNITSTLSTRYKLLQFTFGGFIELYEIISILPQHHFYTCSCSLTKAVNQCSCITELSLVHVICTCCLKLIFQVKIMKEFPSIVTFMKSAQ